MAGSLLDRATTILRLRYERYELRVRPDHAIVERAGAWSVMLREHNERGNRTLMLIGDIGPETAASPRTMLEMAAWLGSGAIALVGGRYFLRYTMPAERIDTPALDDALEYVGCVAADLGSALARYEFPNRELFAHYIG